MKEYIEKFILKIFRFFLRRIKYYYDRVEFKNCKNDVFGYTDCFETVKGLIKFITPKIVCDIGANKGQWSYVLSQVVDLKHVVLFEPQHDLHLLLKDLDLGDAERCIFQCALGENQGEMKLYGGSPSASLLTASKTQHDYFPGSLSKKNELVSINKLDDIYQQNNLPIPDIIKLDVQGYELQVLKGGTDTLKKTKYLVAELSFKEFYVGQPPLWELIKFLNEHGFVLVDQGYILKSRKLPHEILQTDGIFMNKNLVKRGKHYSY